MANSKKEVMHRRFKMGRGKYCLIDIWSAESSKNGTIINKPKHCKMVCGHCGTGMFD